MWPSRKKVASAFLPSYCVDPYYHADPTIELQYIQQKEAHITSDNLLERFQSCNCKYHSILRKSVAVEHKEEFQAHGRMAKLPPSNKGRLQTQDPSILAMCRNIYDEARPVFWAKSTFFFERTADLKYLLKQRTIFHGPCLLTNYANVQHVRLVNDDVNNVRHAFRDRVLALLANENNIVSLVIAPNCPTMLRPAGHRMD